MGKKGYEKFMAMALGFAMLGDSPHGMRRTHSDPSTKYREETCPECGEKHNRDNHIFCSDECHEERKRKIKSGEIK